MRMVLIFSNISKSGAMAARAPSPIFYAPATSCESGMGWRTLHGSVGVSVGGVRVRGRKTFPGTKMYYQCEKDCMPPWRVQIHRIAYFARTRNNCKISPDSQVKRTQGRNVPSGGTLRPWGLEREQSSQGNMRSLEEPASRPQRRGPY